MRSSADNASQMRLYESNWDRFVADCVVHRLCSEEVPRWLTLSGNLLSCMIRLGQNPVILEGVRRIQRTIGRHQQVILHPEPFLHVTVRMFGTVPSGSETLCLLNGLGGVQVPIAAIDRALRGAVAGFPPFRLLLCGVNSWREAPFIQTFDAGAIGDLRERVRAAVPEVPDRTYAGGFMPHLTLGYYRVGVSLAPVAEEIALLREEPVGELVVREVELVWGRGDAPHPQLVTLGRYQLQ